MLSRPQNYSYSNSWTERFSSNERAEFTLLLYLVCSRAGQMWFIFIRTALNTNELAKVIFYLNAANKTKLHKNTAIVI